MSRCCHALARLTLVLAIVNAGGGAAGQSVAAGSAFRSVPAIVQDVTVIALFCVIGTVLLREQLLTTSAVGAVVVGFALQDTLGNFFAGLAIQIEKPFRVGHWMQSAIAKARCRRSPGAPPSCAPRTASS